MQLNLESLRALYKSKGARPSDVIAAVYDRIAASDAPIWISVLPREKALAKARKLEQSALADSLPLYGVPFAIKDNIDLAGIPTTAACPAFAYVPQRSATIVEQLLALGAIPLGKTNLDQFATGLNGSRSPYGACPNSVLPEYPSG